MKSKLIALIVMTMSTLYASARAENAYFGIGIEQSKAEAAYSRHMAPSRDEKDTNYKMHLKQQIDKPIAGELGCVDFDKVHNLSDLSVHANGKAYDIYMGLVGIIPVNVFLYSASLA